MTPAVRRAGPREARQHLAKAREFLDAALSELAAKRYTAAVSNAVVAGINAADVICIGATQSRSADNDHTAALRLLALAGGLGQQAIPHLGALLPAKNLAQYSAVKSTKADAEDAVDHAEALVELATRAAADIPGA